MPVFLSRIFRAAKLDSSVYVEIEPDKPARGQALAVIIFSAIAAGIGDLQDGGLSGFLAGALAALAGWFLWTLVAYFAGAKLLPGHKKYRVAASGYGRMLTYAGFASAPGLVRVLEIIPGLRNAIFLITAVWMIAATVIGMRQALIYRSTLKAAGVCISAWFIQVSAIGVAIYFIRRYAGLV